MEHSPETPVAEPVAPPFSGPLRSVYVFTGVMVPLACFVLSCLGPLDAPEWQSGNITDYAKLLLGGNVNYAFYPLLIYAMVSLVIALRNFEYGKKHFAVRLGVYGGVLVAFTFNCILTLSFGGSSGVDTALQAIFILFVGFFVMAMLIATCRAVVWVWQNNEKGCVGVVVIGSVVVAGIVCVISEGAAIFLPVVACLVFGPVWAFLAYLHVSYKFICEGRQITIAQLFGITGYLAAYMAAGRHSLLRMMEEYSKLPVEQPAGCYIATAAAKGHPGFVRSWLVPRTDGSLRPINRQLQILKAGELALACWLPSFHRFLRRNYNCWGPRIAGLLGWRVLADLAYLALKPVEWCVVGVLWLIVPAAIGGSGQLYGADKRIRSSRKAAKTGRGEEECRSK